MFLSPMSMANWGRSSPSGRGSAHHYGTPQPSAPFAASKCFVKQDDRCDVSVWTYIFHWGLSSSFTGLRSILDFAFHEGSRFTFKHV